MTNETKAFLINAFVEVVLKLQVAGVVINKSPDEIRKNFEALDDYTLGQLFAEGLATEVFALRDVQ